MESADESAVAAVPENSRPKTEAIKRASWRISNGRGRGMLPRNSLDRKRRHTSNPKEQGIARSAGARATESGEVHEVRFRDRLDGLTGLAPGGETADDDKSVESLFAQQMRHTGAGGFALSSTVEVDVFVLRKIFDFV